MIALHALGYSNDPVTVPDGYVRCTTMNPSRCTFAFVPAAGSRIKRCDRCRGNTARAAANQARRPQKDVCIPVGHVRCTREKAPWRCTNTFVPGGSSSTRCPRCRETVQRDNGSDAGRNRLSRYGHGPKGKIVKKRYQAKIMTKVGHALRDQLSGRERPSWLGDVQPRLAPVTEFKNEVDARNHFEQLFEDWMTWENAGEYRKKMSYKTVWHIGHRVPKSVYDESDIEDMRRCWSKANLYPQDGKDNVTKQTILPSRDVLLSLRSIWPKRWTKSPPACLV